MSLSNAQYEELMRRYDARQLYNEHVAQKRRDELYHRYPRLKELDALTAAASVGHAKRLLDGDRSSIKRLKQELEVYRKERKAIFTLAKLDEHYLDPPYACPDCKDTGFIDGQRCHCFDQAVIDLVYTQSNIKSVLQDENFSTLSLDYYSDTKLIEGDSGLTEKESARLAVKESFVFIKNFTSLFDNLLLLGNTGTGKTFLSNCIAKELLDRGHSVIYFSAFELFEFLAKYRFGKDDEPTSSLHIIFDCDLLIIDDLGTELSNAFTVSQLFLCLNERMLRRKSTLISTNMNMDKLSTIYTERIVSRIVSEYTIIRLYCDDIRYQKRNIK